MNRLLLLLLILSAAIGRIEADSGLPGEEVSGSEREVERSRERVIKEPALPRRGANWLAPSVEEQLSRDITLISLSKGAIFVPSFSEPRREPEVSIFNANGREAANGQSGSRILVDSGTYVVRYGSGTAGQQLSYTVEVAEGHTTVVPPTWSGLIVETLSRDGEYLDAQYEIIRLSTGESYGKGYGYKEERLQDIKSWILPPGVYRLGRVGDNLGSLTNYITVQVNPGEISLVELIYDTQGLEILSGGIKALQTRQRVGRNWSLGIRAGGLVNLFWKDEGTGSRSDGIIIATDARTRLRFDNSLYFGLSEIFLQSNFSKSGGKPLIVSSDILQARSTWVRRMNQWVGPYVRGQLETHFFPVKSPEETVYIVSPGENPDTLETITGGGFEFKPPLYPLRFTEGIGVNLELMSSTSLEFSTQLGVAARQHIFGGSYLATDNPRQFLIPSDLYEIGVENIINARLRLGSMLTVDFRSELFAPEGNPRDIELVEFTTDLRVLLTRNLEVGYLFRLKELVEQVDNPYRVDHNLLIRLSFNF